MKKRKTTRQRPRSAAAEIRRIGVEPNNLRAQIKAPAGPLPADVKELQQLVHVHKGTADLRLQQLNELQRKLTEADQLRLKVLRKIEEMTRLVDKLHELAHPEKYSGDELYDDY